MRCDATVDPIPGVFPPEKADEDRRRTVMRWGMLALLALALFAAWAAGPYLAGELRRLEPWKIAAICCGDAIAAAWFVRFAVLYFLLGASLRDKPAGPAARWALYAFLISMIGGLALDAGFTVYLRYQEQARYAIATPATAAVRSMTTNHASKGRNWTLHCEWQHPPTGQTFYPALRVHADAADEGDPLAGLPLALPVEIARALAQNRSPHTAPIRFDPDWPERSWLEGVPDDDNGLFFVSLFVLLVQGVIILIAAIAVWDRVFGLRHPCSLPWWMELSKGIPTGVEIVVLAVAGAMFRIFGV